jgi:thiol-disulfide isomerase/thioredoxin
MTDYINKFEDIIEKINTLELKMELSDSESVKEYNKLVDDLHLLHASLIKDINSNSDLILTSKFRIIEHNVISIIEKYVESRDKLNEKEKESHEAELKKRREIHIPIADDTNPSQSGGNMTNKDKNYLVLFYVDWCPHCKKFMPIWNEFENSYKNNNMLQFKKIDCVKHGDDCSKKFGVSLYPTIKLFSNDGKTIDYIGKRDIDSLNEFIKKNI